MYVVRNIGNSGPPLFPHIRTIPYLTNAGTEIRVKKSREIYPGLRIKSLARFTITQKQQYHLLSHRLE